MRELDIEEIEKLEFVHLERIRYNFLDNINEIIDGLNSRLAIRSDWYEQFVGAKKKVVSDLEMGAERIFHYVFAHSMKHPNSSPIGSDLMYETYDAFVHIDIKTVADSNIGDYKGKIAIQPNQTSYPLSKYGLSPNLPIFYSKIFVKEGKEYKKPTLTYFIYVLHKLASHEICSVLLVCMPNGKLYKEYGDDIIQAGKTKSSVRYSFRKEPRFIILSRKMAKELFRVEFLVKDKRYSQEELIGISNESYNIPIWVEM